MNINEKKDKEMQKELYNNARKVLEIIKQSKNEESKEENGEEK